MTFGIFVLAVNRRCKRFDRVFVGCFQIVVKFAVFLGAAFEFRHQISLNDGDADVPRHRADYFLIIRTITAGICFFSKKNYADELIAVLAANGARVHG